MFILIKLVIVAFLALLVFFVPLGSRPLSGHLRAIWATPESQELKRALTENTLMLETWLESHRALSGEPHTPEVKPRQPEPGTAGAKDPAPKDAAPKDAAPPPSMVAPSSDPIREPAMRRPRRTGSGKTRGETR